MYRLKKYDFICAQESYKYRSYSAREETELIITEFKIISDLKII